MVTLTIDRKTTLHYFHIQTRQLRYIDIFDKYRYLKNIDIRYSNLRISIISKVLIGQFYFPFFGYYIPVKFKKHVHYRKRMGNLKV